MARADDRIPPKEILESQYQKAVRKHDILRALILTLGILITVSVAATVSASLFIQILRIEGSSMADTLWEGDLVVVIDDLPIEKGDIIACRYEDDILVKRVIATGGDLVDIEADGTVIVNGSPLEEPYLTEKSIGSCSIPLPCRVPEGESFVMGDHRTVSIDSRNEAIGCIDDNEMIGKVIFRIWPLRGLGTVE